MTACCLGLWRSRSLVFRVHWFPDLCMTQKRGGHGVGQVSSKSKLFQLRRAMKSETLQLSWNMLGDQATHWQMKFNLHEFELMYTGKTILISHGRWWFANIEASQRNKGGGVNLKNHIKLACPLSAQKSYWSRQLHSFLAPFSKA